MTNDTSFLGRGPLADTTGAAAAELINKYAMPERLLDRPIADLMERPKIAGYCADPSGQFPINTPVAAWTSAAAYHDSRSTDPGVGQSIKEACDWFGLTSEWDRLLAARPAVKLAAVELWGLPEAQKYPLDSDRQVKHAFDYFVKYKRRFSPEDRRTFAGQLVKAAAAHTDIITGDDLWRIEAEAGLGMPAPGWQNEFTLRAKKARDLGYTEIADEIEKMAKDELSGKKLGTFRNAGELADLLVQMDDGDLGWKNSDPLKGLVGDTPSTAAAKLAGVVEAPSGSWYSVNDIDMVPDDICSTLGGLGPIVSKRAKLEKLAKSASFERLAVLHGLTPVRAANRPKVDWKALAVS